MTRSYPILDPSVTGEFVEACDRAIAQVRKLETLGRESGEAYRAELAGRMATYISQRRQAALDGRLVSPKAGTHLGITRFASEHLWGPEGDVFLDAAREIEQIWGKLGS